MESIAEQRQFLCISWRIAGIFNKHRWRCWGHSWVMTYFTCLGWLTIRITFDWWLNMAIQGSWFSSNRGLVEACNFIGGIGLTPAEITSPVDLLTRISWGITTKPPRTRPNPTGCTVIIILLEGHFWDIIVELEMALNSKMANHCGKMLFFPVQEVKERRATFV